MNFNIIKMITPSVCIVGPGVVGQATGKVLVEKGTPLSKAIGQDDTFPAIVPQMIAVGEETGKIDEVLERVSNYFDLEVDHQVKNLTASLEPIIMIVLGIMVALLVISIIMPIYGLTSSFGN